MRTRSLHWHEGLLVLPHHMQALHANVTDNASDALDWSRPYAYGLRRFELEDQALANFEVRIPRLQARLKDGSLISVPENAHLATVDIKEEFEDSSEIYLHLSVPQRERGRPAASLHREDGDSRFLISEEEWEDESAGGDVRTIQTHRYNARIIARPDAVGPRGHESVPIGRLKQAGAEKTAPQLDLEYVPPLLSCDAWRPMITEYLGPIHAQLGSFIKTQADFLRTHGGWSEANQPQIRREIMRLFTVNGWYPFLGQLREARGVHPFEAYLELCRAVGELSLFREDWQPPELPAYDHDNLGPIFRRVRQELEQALKTVGTDVRVSRYPFVGAHEWLEVALDPAWTMGGFDFFVGVKSDLPPDRLEILFAERWLDWKLGSRRTIQQIYRNAEPGLSIKRVAGVHSSLPALKDMTYFQVDRKGVYWDQVVESRALALKFNDKYLRSSPVGQKTVTVIDPKNNPRDLSLELFVLQNG